MSIKPVLVPDHDAADLRDLMNRFSTAAQSATPAAQANRIRQQLTESAEPGVTEARPDVMRHAGDTTIRVVKRGGKPIGEIGTDSEASPGNGQYYVKLYDGSYDAVGFDSPEEALAELKAAIKSMSEGIANADQDPNLAKAYRLGNEAYKAYKTDPARAQAAQDRIEAEFPQYLKMWTTGYHDGERFDKSDVTEGIDPVEQLRADILRFSR